MNSIFIAVLVLIALIFVLKNPITDFINQIFFRDPYGFNLKSRHITYLVILLIAITIVGGMIVGTQDEDRFKNVSKDFNRTQPQSDDGRTNPMFDVNLD
jgi:multisubunit Na+/H+ antiporter MnhB subunit